jgi:hypothetical protein
MVHRLVGRLIGERVQQPPAMGGDPSWLDLTEEWSGWLPPGRAPEGSPVPIEAAVHRWDAESATGTARPMVPPL